MTLPATDYEAIAADYDRRYRDYEWTRAEYEILHFVGNSPADVLEVGCGTGHWLALLHAHGAQVSGLDASRAMLEFARRKLPKAELVHGSAEQLPWPEASFDRVFSFNAIHHFPDQQMFIREAHRVLRAGGSLSTWSLDPHTGMDRWWVYEYFPRTLEIDRERFPRAFDIRSWMIEVGFTDVKTEIDHPADVLLDARTALQSGLVAQGSTSELAMLTEAEFQEGRQRIEYAIEQAEAAGHKLQLSLNLRVYRTIGRVPV